MLNIFFPSTHDGIQMKILSSKKCLYPFSFLRRFYLQALSYYFLLLSHISEYDKIPGCWVYSPGSPGSKEASPSSWCFVLANVKLCPYNGNPIINFFGSAPNNRRVDNVDCYINKKMFVNLLRKIFDDLQENIPFQKLSNSTLS